MKNKEYYFPLIIGSVITAALSVAGFFISVPCGSICAALGASLILIFFIYSKKRIKEIQDLNDYLSLVLGGNYDLAVESNAEGELSILQNNLLKVITMLKTQNEQIKKDKTCLADSLADISHQLKTPLTSMLAACEILENEDSPKKRKEFISIIENRCEKISRLINILLKLSRLDSGAVEIGKDEVSALDVIEESLKPFLLTLDLKNIEVNKNAFDFTFRGSRLWSVEAIQNIIKNCIEHTPEGGKIEIKTDENAVFSKIAISDNGCGIASEDLPHIFERFYRGKNSSEGSAGIGLALSKAVLNSENAAVSVKSEEGAGTEFEIKFYKSVV